MAIQQIINLSLILNGDGSSTSFTYSFDKLFAGQLDSPVINSQTLPSSVALVGSAAPIPSGGVASLDGFGNLVLTFPSSWSGLGIVQVQLNFNSGTLQGTTATWTNATAVNTTWTLPLSGSNTVLVPIINSGTITGGQLQFQVSADGSNWLAIEGTIPSTPQPITAWNLTSGNTAITFSTVGYSYLRVILAVAITGTTPSTTFIIQGTNAAVQSLLSAGCFGIVNSSAPSTSSGGPTPLQLDPSGNLFTTNTRRSQIVTATGNIASTTAANIVAGQGAGIFADLTSIVLTCRQGSTAPVLFGVLVSDGTKSYRFNMSSESTATGGGNPPLTLTFDPPLVATTANVAWTIALTSATDSPSVDYICTFVKQQAA